MDAFQKDLPPLYLYNTETRKKEEITPLDGRTIRMYTCGPTVYNYAHIGNLRTYVFEDLLRRTLKFFGKEVFQVMNLTDVDDKTLKGAIEKGISLKEFTAPYIAAFFQDLQSLRIQPAEVYPEATEYIPEMIGLIQVLLEKKIAYHSSDGSVYYAIHRFPEYGKLSHFRLSDLQKGASQRVFADEYDKEEVQDFVLWKAYDPDRDGTIYWESPFGKGRPGWHIECSAMAMKLLGETIDIHVGGVDNMFPHHENEIAQSEACSCKRFVNHWLHAEHLLVDHKKMSKSLGNVYTLRDLLGKGYSSSQIRYMLLQTHYRTQLNFTFTGLEAAGATLKRIADFVGRIRGIEEPSSFGRVEPLLHKAVSSFTQALADDLNISVALAALFDLIREVHSLCDEKQIGVKEKEAVLTTLELMDSVLGVLPLEQKELPIPQEVQAALEKRQKARAAKDWALADQERAFIFSQGYLIEDTPEGTFLKRI